MAVEMITDKTKIRYWFDHISSLQDASIFHTMQWLEAIQSTYGYCSFVIVNRENDQIKAGLPFLEIDSALTGKRWISLPFTDYYDPLFDQKDLDVIYRYLADLNKNGQAPDVEVRWQIENESACLIQHDVLHLLDLRSDYSKLEKNFHKSHKRNIKTAQKNGVQIKSCTDITSVKEFYHLHVMTRRRQGVPVQPWRFFNNLHKNIISRDLGFVLLAYLQEKCIAGAVFLHWNNILTYKYGASNSRYLNLRPNNLIFSEAIRWGCHHGLNVLDMGKTDCDNVGLRNFKSHWGAEEIPLKYAHLANKLPQQRQHSAILSTGMKLVIQHSPCFITRTLGELFYKDFA